MNRHEEKIKMALDDIGEQEAKKLLKNYPFRADRDDLIRRLYRRGLQQEIISVMAGLSPNTIGRITQGKKRRWDS